MKLKQIKYVMLFVNILTYYTLAMIGRKMWGFKLNFKPLTWQLVAPKLLLLLQTELARVNQICKIKLQEITK